MFLLFSVFYIFNLYRSIYLVGFELDLDFLNYYEFYNSPDLAMDRWGVEVVTPIFFNVGRFVGLDFYTFSFVVGIFWLIPVFLLARTVRVEYLVFYYLFFLIWFSPQFIFLFRQYLGIFFAILFFMYPGRSKVYLVLCFFLSVLSHLSMMIVYFFGLFKLRSKSQYVLLSIFVCAVYFSYFYGFSLLKYFEGVSLFLGVDVVDRKLATIQQLSFGYTSGSSLVYGLLCCSMFLHSFKIFDSNCYRFSIERAFFFSAASALILSEFVIFSNRVGALAYFFSIPYISVVMSKYYFRF